jgi:hypothetical protein
MAVGWRIIANALAEARSVLISRLSSTRAFAPDCRLRSMASHIRNAAIRKVASG